jgi:hypothetical protein
MDLLEFEESREDSTRVKTRRDGAGVCVCDMKWNRKTMQGEIFFVMKRVIKVKSWLIARCLIIVTQLSI